MLRFNIFLLINIQGGLQNNARLQLGYLNQAHDCRFPKN